MGPEAQGPRALATLGLLSLWGPDPTDETGGHLWAAEWWPWPAGWDGALFPSGGLAPCAGVSPQQPAIAAPSVQPFRVPLARRPPLARCHRVGGEVLLPSLSLAQCCWSAGQWGPCTGWCGGSFRPGLPRTVKAHTP